MGLAVFTPMYGECAVPDFALTLSLSPSPIFTMCDELTNLIATVAQLQHAATLKKLWFFREWNQLNWLIKLGWILSASICVSISSVGSCILEGIFSGPQMFYQKSVVWSGLLYMNECISLVIHEVWCWATAVMATKWQWNWPLANWDDCNGRSTIYRWCSLDFPIKTSILMEISRLAMFEGLPCPPQDGKQRKHANKLDKSLTGLDKYHTEVLKGLE